MVSLFQLFHGRRVRVLFVCYGNSCRSQMAEGFARALGAHVLDPQSAGIAPSSHVSSRARLVMAEKGVSLDSNSTKFLTSFDLGQFDLIVNLCEYSLPATSARILKRPLHDPSQGDLHAFRDVRDDVEQLVRSLVKQFRRWSPVYSEECAQAAQPRQLSSSL